MDPDSAFNPEGLLQAVELILMDSRDKAAPLPDDLPDQGIGSATALERLATQVLNGATHLGDPSSFAHMDPPTPWVNWAATLWNASLNQYLLHPATAPVARDIQTRVVAWLAPFFGMDGGHVTAGSTLSNLTALWAARECAGIAEVVAQDAHPPIRKAAHLLGLRFRSLPTDGAGALSEHDPRLVLHARPATGVVVWRPADAALFDRVAARLPPNTASTMIRNGTRRFRNVAANPNANVARLAATLAHAWTLAQSV